MSVLRKTAGTALAVGAQALSMASKLMDATARTLRPSPRSPREADTRREAVVTPPASARSTADVVTVVDEQVPERGRTIEPEPTPTLDETPHVRTSESHISELAAKPAGEVVSAVSGLSTDELRLLTEYELEHKNRKTVLSAIEKALTPDGPTPNRGGNSSAKGNGPAPTKGQQRDIVLPEAGGVPTSGTMDL